MAGLFFGLVIALSALILSYASFLFSETGAELVATIFAACAALVTCFLYMLG